MSFHLFCPYDRSSLFLGRTEGRNALECQKCPYIFKIDVPIYEKLDIKPKEKDDEMTEDWSNAEKVDILCVYNHCDGREAAYYQVQIRSADEPMTTFYKCMKCGGRWREN